MGNYVAPPGNDDGEVLIVRILMRLVLWGLGAYGAKRLYDNYSGSAERAKSAGAALVDRVVRSSERVRGHAQGAASDVASHARAASQEVRDTASEVVDVSQPGAAHGDQSAAREG
ncbi:MAG: hypothetical protein QOG65_3022 [Actinomycetota bacterium]|nr:hypothetical protein [Actinomycetota bacterium]